MEMEIIVRREAGLQHGASDTQHVHTHTHILPWSVRWHRLALQPRTAPVPQLGLC